MKIEDFKTYINNCNFENSLIILLIFRNRSFAMRIFSKQSILSMRYAKKKNNNVVAIIENTNFDTFVVAFNMSIS